MAEKRHNLVIFTCETLEIPKNRQLHTLEIPIIGNFILILSTYIKIHWNESSCNDNGTKQISGQF